MSLDELLFSVLGFWTVILVGMMLIYGASRKWRWLVDPPEWLVFIQPEIMLKSIFGRRFLLYFTYGVGACFVIVGFVGLLQSIILLGKRLGYW